MRYKNRILSLVFLISVGLTGLQAQTATAPSIGNGNESSPYQIENLDNLCWLSQNDTSWDSYFIQTADIDASETITWNSGAGFSPIGKDTKKFTGSYNGQGHIINGLSINRPSSDYIGLFGYTSGASIDSLGMISCHISGSKSVGGLVGLNHFYSTVSTSYSTGSVSGSSYVGGLLGGNFSTVSNSYSTAAVSGNNKVGGLVGYNYYFAKVNNSYSTGSVSGSSSVGGLVGDNYSFTEVNNSYYNSETSGQDVGIGTDYNSQTVTALTTAQMKQSDNFSGWDFTTIWEITKGLTFPRLKGVADGPLILHTLSKTNKTNVAYIDTIQVVDMDNLTISIELLQYPEGMTLVNDSIISWTPTAVGNYTVKIAVTDANGLVNTYSYTIVVTLKGEGTELNPYEIAKLNDLESLSETSSLWGSFFIQTANIDASETGTWDSGAGFSPIGDSATNFLGSYNGQGYIIDSLIINRPSTSYIGLFGYTNGASIDSLGLTSCAISGDNYVGGLVGYNSSSIISNTYSTGSVSGDVDVGGLVGRNYELSTICNSYSAGSVSGTSEIGGLVGINYNSELSNSYSVAAVSGNNIVGGLAGYNYSLSKVSNSYSVGAVSGGSSLGGLVGYNYSSEVNNSYYNSETSGQSEGIDSDYNDQTVTALTTAQMKQSSSFSSWDFTETWEITKGVTFPRLRSVSNGPIILHTLSKTKKTDVAYNDTIRVLSMDASTISIELLQYPEGMTLVNDSIIIWTTAIPENYKVKVAATDANGMLNTYSYTIFAEFNGEGTEGNPYKIATLNDLKILSETPSIWESCFIQTANIDASETNTWNSGDGFSPIGNSIRIFKGNYHGQGHIINGLSINRPSSLRIGLFGYTRGATIDSLGMTSCAISGYDYVGGLVGYFHDSSSISDCYSTGSVSGRASIGGLVGFNIKSSSISNSYFTGSVSGSISVGGLVGENYSSIVSNNYSTGAVSGDERVGGLVGFNFNSSSISNSYSVGAVSGGSFLGGLVGYNSNSSTVSNSYSSGSVSGSSDVGGLVGRTSTSTVSNSYYNSETSGQNDTDKGVPLTTAQMKQSDNFNTWAFTTIWGINEDNTYPALLAISNNAPFAFADTLSVAVSSSLFTGIRSVLTNDYDYETGQDLLTVKIITSPTKGSISNGVYSFNANTAAGTQDSFSYCVGELIANGDTLWGNYALVTITKLENTAPTLTTVSSKTIDEDSFLTLSFENVTTSDVNNDVLSLVIITGDNYTLDDMTLTPAADFYGTLTVPLAISDGELNSDTLDMTITVNAINDAPVLSAVATDLTVNEDQTLYLSMSNVTVSDVDNDVLSLVISIGDNYTVDGIAINPVADFNGALTVGIAVSDGELISNSLDMTITVRASVTGLTEQSIKAITVYPNPATTSIFVEGSSAIAIVYNLAGRAVLTHDLSQNQSINISQLSSGMYILRVDGWNMKIVKE